jgi:integrase
VIEKFRAKFGQYPVKLLRRPHLAAMADRIEKPHARRNWLKAVRGLLQYAVEIGMRPDDPSYGMKMSLPSKSDGFCTWGEPEIAGFRRHHAIGTRARLAFELLLNTGQRRGDVIRMGRQHLHAGKLIVKQRKTGATLKIPLLPELLAVIEATPADNLTFLTTALGKPYTAAGFENRRNLFIPSGP